MGKLLSQCLAIVGILFLSQLCALEAKGIKHRFKWGRKVLPSTPQTTEAPQVTEARVAEIKPGAFIREGRKLDIDLAGEDKQYYEDNYWQFPDGIYYNGCLDANVTKKMLIGGCINATKAANQEELSFEKQDKLHQRVLWRLVRELCARKHCDFWVERDTGSTSSNSGSFTSARVDVQLRVLLLGLLWVVWVLAK